MKKIKYYFSFLLLFMGLTMGQANVHTRGEQITQLEDGDTIAIKGACQMGSGTPQQYMAGTGNSEGITDSALYVAIDAGMKNEIQAWYFKNVSKNAYMSYEYESEDMMAFQNITYTKDINLAAPFWVTLADSSDTGDGTIASYVQASYYYGETNDKTVTITYAEDIEAYLDEGATFWWLSNIFGDTPPTLSSYRDTNICNIYRTSNNIDAEETLFNALAKYQDIESMYTAGTTIGCVPQEYVDAALKAYEDAQNAASGSDEEKLAAVSTLIKAIQDCEDNIISIKDGYYSFRGAPDNSDRCAALYAGEEKAMWEALPSDSVLSEPKHVWKVTCRRTVNGVKQYDMMNVQTGYYMQGTQTNASQPVFVGADTTSNAIEFTTADNGYFYISSTNPENANSAYKYFHILGWGGSGSNLVLYSQCLGSKWNIKPIDQAIIDEMHDKVVQNQLNIKLQALLDKAFPKLQMSRNYSTIDDIKNDFDYSNEGLISEPEQIWSNATLEGFGTENLVNQTVKKADADRDYFHSIWSGSVKIEGYHNLQMHLSKPVSCFAFKMSPRLCNLCNAVTDATIYACNDTTGGNQWVEVSKLTNLFVDRVKDTVIISPCIEMDTKYEYIRFDVTKTIDNALYGGVPNFSMGEFHAYEAAYDPDNSQYENIDNAAAFKSSVEEAMAELSKEKATQETLDKLQTEYDAFVAVLADPELFEMKAAEAQLYIDNAQVGDQPGYMTEDVTANDLSAAIETARTSLNVKSTKSDVQKAIDDVDAAIATFKSKLIKVPYDTWFFIQSASSSQSAGSNAMYVKYSKMGFDTRWAGKDTLANDGTLDAVINSKSNYLWHLVKTDYADSIYVQNLGTGAYLTTNASLTYEPTCIALDNTMLPGIFNFIFPNNEEDDTQYLNVVPKANSYDGDVTGNTTADIKGNDNAAWKFVPLEKDITKYEFNTELIQNAYQAVTLPYDLIGYGYYGIMYSVVGINGNKLVLSELDPSQENSIAAGTPIVMDMTLDATAKTESFYTSGAITSQPLTINGVVGVFASKIISEEGTGYLSDNKIKTTTEDIAARILPFSAYFTGAVPTTEEAGDATLDIEGTITDIQNTKIVNNKTLVNVYNISGVLIRKNISASSATKDLPKGLYIVGNEKVLVK